METFNKKCAELDERGAISMACEWVRATLPLWEAECADPEFAKLGFQPTPSHCLDLALGWLCSRGASKTDLIDASQILGAVLKRVERFDRASGWEDRPSASYYVVKATQYALEGNALWASESCAEARGAAAWRAVYAKEEDVLKADQARKEAMEKERKKQTRQLSIYSESTFPVFPYY